MRKTNNVGGNLQKIQGIDTGKFRTSVLRTFVLFAIFLLMIEGKKGRDYDDLIM